MLALDASIARATRDLDLSVLSDGPQGLKAIRDALVEACAARPEHDDGLEFAIDGKVTVIREVSNNPTVRANVSAVLRCGDVPRKDVVIRFLLDVTPSELDHVPVARGVPSILPDYPPTLFPSYPWEAVLAEKLHAMVSGTIANHRLRDWGDIVKLRDSGIIDADVAADTIRRVFDSRNSTHLLSDPDPVGLSFKFATQRQKDWVSTLETTGYGASMPQDFAEAVSAVREFCLPLLARAAEAETKSQILTVSGRGLFGAS